MSYNPESFLCTPVSPTLTIASGGFFMSSTDRRSFLKKGAALSASLAAAGLYPRRTFAQGPSKFRRIAYRQLGSTGYKVSEVGFGAMNTRDPELIHAAIDAGINYIDTAHGYMKGVNEEIVGKVMKTKRDKVYLVTKVHCRDKTPQKIREMMELSLKRLKLDYVDTMFMHMPDKPEEILNEDRIKAFEKAKKDGLCRYVGVSIHTNHVALLDAAVESKFWEHMLVGYNYKSPQEVTVALKRTREAGIGIIAMKTTGKTTISRFRLALETAADKKLIEHLLQRGFVQEQATIKLVLGDERISCACVGMESVAVLTANVAAVLDKTELTQTDKEIFKQYAEATCSGYCAGCAEICNAALVDLPYVSDIMRYLMYYNSYGDKDRARGLFAQIPARVRNKLLSTDYSTVEARCPQHLPIGKLVAEAVGKLA